MPDPLPENDLATQRRSTFLVAVVGALVLVVVALVILRSQGPEARRTSDAERSAQALGDSSTAVDQAVLDFRDEHGVWPAKAWTEGRTLVLSGTSDAGDKRVPGVAKGVMLAWYRSDSHRFAYCLSGGLRYPTAVQTATRTDKAGFEGACPAASLTPDLTPP